jgi:AcrR family transcriptional regulator
MAHQPPPIPAAPEELEDTRPRRSDAVRNRSRVIAAATTVFGEHGLDAPVPDIARLAGVGKGTVYRNFPTKEHLAAAVVVARLGCYEAVLAEAVRSAGPAEALRGVFSAAAEHLSRDRVLGQAVGLVGDDPDVLAAQRRIRAIIAATLARAQQAGLAREDVTADDVSALVVGVARALPPRSQGGRPELWDRLMLLAHDALRPGGAATLPGGFAGEDEARQAMWAARQAR